MKKLCFQSALLEKTLESHLDCKRSNQSSIVIIGRIDAEAPILWPPTQKTDSLEKTLMLGNIEGKRRRG